MTAATPDFREYCEARLDELLEAGRQYIADGSQHPTLFVVDSMRPGQHAIAPFDIESDEDRMKAASLHRELASRPDIVACVTFVTEAWAISMERKPGDPVPVLPTGSIKDLPDRTEVLSFSFIRGDMQLVSMCPITRPDNAVTKGPLMDPADGMLGGRFINHEPTRH